MLPVLRQAAPQPLVRHVWQKARRLNAPDGLPCPSCRYPAREVQVLLGEALRALDVCSACHVVWFDRQEFLSLPRPEGAAAPVPAYRRPLRRRPRTMLDRPGLAWPDAWWKYVPGLFGLPVEFEAVPVSRAPWATYALLAAVGIVSLVALADLPAAVAALAFVPADPYRLGGLTVLTSFFLHAGWFHLLSNLYFLWVFGDNVEDHLGPGRFLLLVFAAVVVGDVAHATITSEPYTPCVGASGGISGVIVYYALAFPRIRLGLLFWFVIWLRFSALVGLFLWLGFQVVGLYLGGGAIAYGAHLGGAAVGAIAWGLDRWAGPASQPHI